MSQSEEIIVQVLKENGCHGQENMISPSQLLEKCIEKGLDSSNEVEAAIVSLVDQDVVEYEMDDNLNTTQLWLL